MSYQNSKDRIVIIDFGSQVTKLIARRIREFGVFSEIITLKDLAKIKNYNKLKESFLSGGPSTVTKKLSVHTKRNIVKKIPILGICYGLQLITKIFGGSIKSSKKRKESSEERYFIKKEDSLLIKIFF